MPPIPQVLAAANLPSARRLFVTIPEAFEAGQVVEQARAANPGLEIVARAHSDAAVAHLEDLGCSLAVMGEHEIAMRMLEHAGVDEAKPISSGGSCRRFKRMTTAGRLRQEAKATSMLTFTGNLLGRRGCLPGGKPIDCFPFLLKQNP